MRKTEIVPFVKWAGGKRQLLSQIQERMPENYNHYFEPFVGGGAVFFGTQPSKALINDINKALINTYQRICNSPKEFLSEVNKIDSQICEDGKQYYYSLYRVNGKGLFNVPYNNSRRASVEENVIWAVSEYLQNITILQGDFEDACKEAKKGDFVFLDSPYAPLNPTSFEAYTKEGFDIESHKRLAKLYDELTMRGCYCMLTNHNTDLINELYGNKGYKIDVVSVRRMINSDASNRVGEEVIICNY